MNVVEGGNVVRAMPGVSRLLLSPLFLLSLAAMVINDAYLKGHCPGLVSGKLSDVAGLFAFYLFLLAVVGRWPLGLALLVCAGFTYWKTSASIGLILWINDHLPVHIGRTVDPTDLWALVVLPAAWWYAASRRWACQDPAPTTWLRWAILVTAPVIFTADSVRTNEECLREYQLDDPATAEVAAIFRIAGVSADRPGDSFIYRYTGEGANIRMHALIRSRGDKTIIVLYQVEGKGRPYRLDELLERFEAKVMTPSGRWHRVD